MSATVVSDLTGFYKQRYKDKLVDAVPRATVVTRRVPFVSKTKLGDAYNFPVVLADTQGFTYNTSTGNDLVTLNDPVSMVMQNALIRGSEITARAAMNYQAASRATSSMEAFGDAYDNIVKNLLVSTAKRLELVNLYGGSGIGQVAANSETASTSTTITFPITTSQWAGGIWAGLKNAKVNFYTAAGVLVSTGADAVFTVTTVNSNARTVLFTGTSTGITDLETSADTNVLNIFFQGAYNVEATGMKAIMTNTGTLFNISATDYDLWAANTYSANGRLTFAKVQEALANAVDRGLDEDVLCLVNPRTWANLNSDIAATRMMDSSYRVSRGELGNENISFHGQNGKVEIVPHIFVKEGDAFIFSPDSAARVGSTDITQVIPGTPGQEIFFHLPEKNGIETRCFSDQGLILEEPAKSVYISGIVNS